jgi:hypothetical protein
MGTGFGMGARGPSTTVTRLTGDPSQTRDFLGGSKSGFGKSKGQIVANIRSSTLPGASSIKPENIAENIAEITKYVVKPVENGSSSSL